MDQIWPEQAPELGFLPKPDNTKLFPDKFEEKSRSRNIVDAIVRE